MADVFISYARPDKKQIEYLAGALVSVGFSVWWDHEIETGDSFSKKIQRELQSAKAVIVAWSEHSIESDWVKDEASYANKQSKLFPIRLDASEPPLGFQQYQVNDFIKWRGDTASEAFLMLTAALRRKIDNMGASKPPAPELLKTKNISFFQKTLRRPVITLSASVLAVIFAAGVIFWRAGVLPLTQKTAEAVNDYNSIAIMPFADMSERGDQEYFTDGVSEEILNALAPIPDLKVAGRTSSFSFRGRTQDLRAIGEALAVNHILEGSVRRSGDKIRITAQLIRTDSGFQVWSETYDRQEADIFDIQDEIANAVAQKLVSTLGLSHPYIATKRTNDMTVYDNYLLAKSMIDKRGLENLKVAHALLDEAMALDPTFAPAWAEIARLFSVYEAYAKEDQEPVAPHQWLSIGRAAAERAIELQPNNATAHAFLGAILTMEFEWIEGFQHLDRAIDAAPKDAAVLDMFAQKLNESGYAAEARQLSQRAISIDPLVALYHNNLGDSLWNENKTDEALEAYYRAVQLDPYLIFAYDNLFFLLIELDRFDDARAIIDLAARNGVEDDMLSGATYPAFLAAAQNDDHALREMFSQREQGMDDNIAHRLKDVTLLISVMERDWNNPDRRSVNLFGHTKRFLKNHPRWKEQVRRDGIYGLWRARGFPASCRPIVNDNFECD